MEDQKKKQAEAIEQLRGQLEELESYAYMSGDSAPPSALVLDRQRMVMERPPHSSETQHTQKAAVAARARRPSASQASRSTTARM